MTLAQTKEAVMTAVRATARLSAATALTPFYVAGWLAGLVAVASVTMLTAVRLGWSDARKRGTHGAA